MENKNFFQRSWQSIAMFVALVSLWILSGVSFWYAIIFLIFFWSRNQMEWKASNYRALSIAMFVVFLIALGNAGFNKAMPRSASKKVSTGAFIDQIFSKGAPSATKVRAQDIFDQNYKDASEKVLAEFKKLVREGKIEEADKLIRDFEKKWTFQPFRKKSPEHSQDSSSSASDNFSAVEQTQVQNLTLYKGSWYVDVRGFSSNIIIKTRPGRDMYTIEPIDGVYDYEILMAGASQAIAAHPDIRLPGMEEPKFQIIYRGNFQPKRFKVTVR